MGNYIGKLTQCTLDSTGIVNKYHVFFSVLSMSHYVQIVLTQLDKLFIPIYITLDQLDYT